jgi:diguanylate cyclase (GGDEF)-like protein
MSDSTSLGPGEDDPRVVAGTPWQDGLAFLEPVADSLECGLLLIDGQRRIVLASAPMAAMFGLSVAALKEMRPDQLVDYVASLVDDPPQLLRDRRILPPDALVVCEEFEIVRPVRSVVRWVARRVAAPLPGQIVVCTDITAEVDLTAAYERLAVTDRLTGLANRRGVEQMARREIVRVRRFAAPLSFVMFDIDHFKQVNDGHGHGAGDEVLQKIGRGMAGQLRETDLAARWGGEEFLLVLPNTALEAAHRCADRIRRGVSELMLPIGRAVTISGGVAQLGPGETLNEVVARADGQLYRAKAEGRNRIC